MPDEGRILGICVTGGFTGEETVAAAPFFDSLEDTQSQTAVNISPGDYLVVTDAQRAVLGDIVDIILNGGKEKTEVIILPSARGNELDSLLLQPFYQVTESVR